MRASIDLRGNARQRADLSPGARCRLRRGVPKDYSTRPGLSVGQQRTARPSVGNDVRALPRIIPRCLSRGRMARLEVGGVTQHESAFVQSRAGPVGWAGFVSQWRPLALPS